MLEGDQSGQQVDGQQSKHTSPNNAVHLYCLVRPFRAFRFKPLDTLIRLNYSHTTSTAITEALIPVSPVGVFVSLAISAKVIDGCAANNSLRKSVSGSHNHSWKFFFMSGAALFFFANTTLVVAEPWQLMFVNASQTKASP
jgi:hypothetical protein